MPSHLSPCVTASTWKVGHLSTLTLAALNCDNANQVNTVTGWLSGRKKVKGGGKNGLFVNTDCLKVEEFCEEKHNLYVSKS